MKLDQTKSRLTAALCLTVLSSWAVYGPEVQAQTTRRTQTTVQNAPTLSIDEVRTVFHRRALGNVYFTAQLRAELASQGLRFVSNPRQADAILDSAGQYNGRAFVGQMTFFDQRGRVIWSQNIFRPDNISFKAYQRQANRARARR